MVPIMVISMAILACSISQIPQITPTSTIDKQAVLDPATETILPTFTITHRPHPTQTSTPYVEEHTLGEVYATDPNDFILTSGQTQFIELFGFW